MCGIAGYWYFGKKIKRPESILAMSREIKHRGSDDEGFVLIDLKEMTHMELSSDESPPEIRERYPNIDRGPHVFSHDIALAHRRFAIIDLTASGHQPMKNDDQTIWLVCNGEIFNYIELRAELEKMGVVFHSASDTEVILKSYQFWGMKAFDRFSGFWAISLVDLNQHVLILSRDRIGKKPLYYYKNNTCLVWGSEIKSILKVIASTELNLDDQVITNYLISGIKDFRHKTFWQEIRMMDNATTLTVRADGSFSSDRFWMLPERRLNESQVDLLPVVRDFRDIMRVSLLERLRADVPVAFELSGGLDSSSLVALRSVLKKDKFPAFTVKYDDKSVDESDYAMELSSCYPNIDHQLINFQEENLWPVLDDFIYLLEEPFHGPVLLIGQLLRKKIREKGYRVIIGGAGGDEIFAGYTEYAIPVLRYLFQSRQPVKMLKNLLLYKEKYPLSFFPLLSLVIRKMVGWKGDAGFHSRYLKGNHDQPVFHQYPKDVNELFIQNMNDLKMYYWMSSNDKSDMGIPIEVRNPFLDYRVVDFVFRLPISYFMRNGWLKWFQRKSFQDILPERIIWRKRKRGFPFPMKSWLMNNKSIIGGHIRNSDAFWMNREAVLGDYDRLVRMKPEFLWRLLNLEFWYSRFFRGEKLADKTDIRDRA
jgi:asparagine synthase (glutamine-hydrolysing)